MKWIYIAFCMGSTGEWVMARNGDIGENVLFIMAKRDISKGFSLPGI